MTNPVRRRVRSFAAQLARGAGIALAVVPALLHPARAADPAAQDPSDAWFAQTNIPLIRIEISAAGMDALRAYEFRRGSNPEARTNVSATLREGTRVYTNVAVHLKGSLGSFRDVDDRPALTVSFDKWVENQSFHGLKKISLNNSVQDPSYASEIVSRELFRKAGLPTPRATHAHVQLNGRKLGLYVVLEGWNKQFLKRHFADATGTLWDSGSAGDISANLDASSGDRDANREPLDALVRACAIEAFSARIEAMEKIVDLDRFITLMAAEVMLVHWDGYAMNKNNYRVFHDRSVDRLIFLPQGMDQMFGQFRRWDPETSIAPMMKGLAARAVMQVPEQRRRYFKRMEMLFNTLYDIPRLTNQVDTVTAKLQGAFDDDVLSRARQLRAAALLKERIVRRAASVRSQLTTETTPVRFDKSSELALTDWKSNPDSGRPAFRRQAVPDETLEITAPGSVALGSWRTGVCLEDGDYQFVGRVKIVGADYESTENPGATLRMSGERKAKMIRDAAAWTEITYEFTVHGVENIDLLCEFRARRGTAIFEETSLKLRKVRGETGKPGERK